MKIYLLILLVATALVGCDGGTLNSNGYTPPNRPWEDAALNHRCTAEQMKRVEAEHLFCKEHTTYFNSYCYGSAIMRNCTLKDK